MSDVKKKPTAPKTGKAADEKIKEEVLENIMEELEEEAKDKEVKKEQEAAEAYKVFFPVTFA